MEGKRHLRFSIRDILWAITLLSVVLGYYFHDRKRQQEAEARVEDMANYYNNLREGMFIDLISESLLARGLLRGEQKETIEHVAELNTEIRKLKDEVKQLRKQVGK